MKVRIVNLCLCFGFLFTMFSSTPIFADFNANHVIDDNVFDSQTMDAAQIDNFLNSFNSSCISTNNGFAAPLPTGYSPNSSFSYGAYVSAGQVIYTASKVYGLNPQVILSTLEKEQSLVSGSNGCSVLRYAAAMGYGCPDGGNNHNYPAEGALVAGLYSINSSPVTAVSGTCVNSARKVGFSEQVIIASWQMKFDQQRSLGNTSWDIQLTNFPISGSNWDNSDDPTSCYSNRMTSGYRKSCSNGASIYYDGLYTIDNTTVSMDTGATAALYNYTPHLAGNQSFYTIFNRWFGASYSADLYTDSDKDTVVNRYDMCLFSSGSPVNFGCPDNTTLDTSGYSGDFNGDGYNDLVVTSLCPDGKSFNLWLYKGTANSGFSAPVIQNVLGNGNPTLGPTNGGFDFNKSKIIAVNVNGDGYTDLVIFHQGPHNEIVRNVLIGSSGGLTLNNSMTVWQTPATGWQWNYLRIAGSGDFNGDSYSDVVAFSQYPDAKTFNVWLYTGSLSNGLTDTVFQTTLGPGSGGWDFTKTKAVAANVNGDAYQDMVLLHQGPSDEVVRHVLKGSASGLQPDDSNWVVWQFPSQGWKWSNIRIVGSGNFKGGIYDGIAVASVFPDGRTYNLWLYNGGSSAWGSSDLQSTLGPNNGGWDFTKSKPVASNVNNDAYRDLVIMHQGPHDEVVFNILQGSSSGLNQNPNWTLWEFPSQGWKWTNIRAVRNSN